MVSPYAISSHSAVVNMALHVNGQTIRVAQMGPSFLILKEAIEIPPASGFVTLDVDGTVETYDVDFPQGINSVRKRIDVMPVRREMAAVQGC